LLCSAHPTFPRQRFKANTGYFTAALRTLQLAGWLDIGAEGILVEPRLVPLARAVPATLVETLHIAATELLTENRAKFLATQVWNSQAPRATHLVQATLCASRWNMLDQRGRWIGLAHCFAPANGRFCRRWRGRLCKHAGRCPRYSHLVRVSK
jgi:hypothetical protein